MSALLSFRMPDVGEGLTEAEILHWTVAVGDQVTVNQVIVEIETVKAAVELPCPYAGTVTAVLAAEGETVAVGTPIITIDTSGGAPADAGSGSAAATEVVETVPAQAEPAEPGLLVGYGPRESGPRRRRPMLVPASASPASASPATAGPATASPVTPEPAAARPLAKPPVRRLAKDLGVDLRAVAPSGPQGTITREDVRAAAPQQQPVPAGPALAPSPPERDQPEGDLPEPPEGVPAAGPGAEGETRIPIRGVRKHTAAAMVRSAFTAPHVTEFITLDISATMELRDRVAKRPEFAGVKLSPLVFVARALLLAVRRTPELNATWDEQAQEIVLKHYVNLGIAAATGRGLMVPNIKDAHRLPLLDLACAVNDLAATARSGRSTPAQLSGGTITITNVGVWGVDTGTPILNPGEAAILAMGAVRRQPWVVGAGADERIEPRWVTQLALSFDHRLVDGQQGSQALSDIAAVLTDPALAVL